MAVTKKDKSGDQLIVNQLIIKTPNRSSSDVGKWRDALKSGDKGKVKNLYDLFEDLKIDGVLSDAIDKRVDAIKLANLTFQNIDGQEVEEITGLIDSPGFENLIDTIMQTKFWGRSGGEFNFSVEEGFEFEPLPPKHIKLETNSIIINDTDETGIDFTTDELLLVLGKPRQFGLLLKAAPYVIWKRGGFGDWAEWLEIFGMPRRIGKYSTSDPQSRLLLEEAFEKGGSAPWMVIPKETDVETDKDDGGGSSGTSYNDFRKACNEEILITILGQTMTTIDGSSRSQSETHLEVEQNKHKADMRFVQRVLNYIVKPMLEKRGLPVSNGKFVFPDDTEQTTVEELVKLSDIIEIPTTYFYERFGIPQADEGDDIARKQNTSLAFGGDIENTDDQRNFLIRLWDFFAAAPAQAGATSVTHIKLNDADFTDRLLKQVAEGDKWSIELFEFISSDLVKALYAKPVKLADLGFTYQHESDAFRTAQELNIFRFSAAKTLAEIQDLNDIYRKSKNFDAFYKEASQRADVFNKVWQKTEYQSATLISESTANYNRLKKQTNIFPYWEYRTVGDDKVRPEHAALHGLILPANDPRWKQIWPPNGWKCRCYIVPRMAHEVEGIDIAAQRKRADDYMNSGEWKSIKAQGFGVNRALVPEVFSENQMYIAKFANNASKWLKNINYQTYKLGSFEQNRKKAAGNLPMFQGDLNDYAKALQAEKEMQFFTDYNSRLIKFDVEKWKKSHVNKTNQRTPYIKAAGEAVKTPDEVWINAGQSVYRLAKNIANSKPNKFSQYVFLKYYNDTTIAVIANIKGGNVYEVVTWFPVTEKSDIAKKLRSGLLIKKPSL